MEGNKMRKRRNWLPLLAVLVMAVLAMTTGAFAAGEEAAEYVSPFHATAWSLLPPVIAIGLALITKEVYSSLFIGILTGGLLYSGFQFEGTVLHVFQDGVVSVLSDSYNVGILIFLVILGAMVCLMNKAGGSAAFGRWAAQNIKSRVGAQLASIVLGVLIFIDDYFNCLTVGSVMRPITDKHNVSRVKLAYLIDATAAPVCIIAPISSWAAAVSSYVPDGQGLSIFIKAIPFNFYALFTIVMMISMVVMKVEFGPMLRYERNAVQTGDLFSGSNPYAGLIEEDSEDSRGTVIDLVLPILVLVGACVIGMLYSGSFFDPASASHMNIASAFSSSDASVGLMLGSSFGLLFTLVFYGLRRAMSFTELMDCLPEGFKQMVPAILILCLAWTIGDVTKALGAPEFVADLVSKFGPGLKNFLPAVVFLIAAFLGFATGTSWGTFTILLPIVIPVFSGGIPAADLTSELINGNDMLMIAIAATLGGAVMGDHCSPISDTTIMASSGAQCYHLNHVATQLPYAMTVAAVCFANYILASFIQNVVINLAIAIVCMVVVLLVIGKLNHSMNRHSQRD